MKKVLGIFYNSSFTEESFETGCGGSETWAIQLAKEFSKRNYHVIIFCHCESKTYDSGVEYVPISLYESRIKYQYFTYFIFTRSIDVSYDIFIANNDCRNIYIQSHDMFIWENGIYNSRYVYDEERNQDLKYNYIKKFIALTDFHKEELHMYNGIPYDKIAVIGNGLDSNIFDEAERFTVEKDNSILFPTAFGRGGNILVNDIMPRVLEKIPDFEVHICGYGDNVPDDIKKNPHVKFLGTLKKRDYYLEFKKHKCWFLPCVVVEDFGICAGEAAMCECDIVSPFKHGMKDVCWGFTSLKMENEFKVKETGKYHYSTYTLNMTDDEYNKACDEAANKIIDSINNYYNEDRKKIRAICKEFIIKEHTWANVANKWENIFNLY